MKTLKDFEDKHGGTRIAALEGALEATAQKRTPITLEVPGKDNTIWFGVIGDTHYGSLYECKDELAAMYRAFKAAGVKNVLHAGDLIDGHRVYRGQEFELHRHGWAEQRDHFVKHAPKESGITTYFITGNHDASMKKAAGMDVGAELADRRKDWHFCGEDYAAIDFVTGNGRKFKVAMIHPSGGSAYALSYRPQKIAEQIEGGSKPNLLAVGHYHKAEFMPSYRNIAVLQVGCFQRQTPFMVTKGLAAHVGGWIVRVTVQSKNALSNSIQAEFVAFYRQG
jgi:predicted phosphodiesterase